MQLSRTRIAGPKYDFCYGQDGKTFVAYSYRDESYRIPITFFSKPYADNGQRLTVEVTNSSGKSPAHQVSIIKPEEPHFLDLHFDRRYRGTGLVFVFHNMMLYHMVVTCKLDPPKIFIYNAIGRETATFGAMALNIKLGISRLNNETIQKFLEAAEADPLPARIEYLKGRKGSPIEVLNIGNRRVMFVPQLSIRAMENLAKDLYGLEYLLRTGYAYLDRSNYYILPEAARRMSDYVRLLPQNPRVVEINNRPRLAAAAGK